ncbi:MAG: preprotein translocase subunit YajC [Deltaproteobacteria bacterium]|nr:preprotein translocase subunit YajC [Deltaproteobacteria bacterium]
MTSQLQLLAGRLLPLLALQPSASPTRPSSGGGGGGAAGGAAGGSSGPGALIAQFAPMILIVGFIYFFMLRPMNKQRQEQDSFNAGLKKGDRVVTQSGIVGTVVSLEAQEVTLEVARGVQMTFLRNTVTQRYQPGGTPAASGDTATSKP